jgi:hypothetical protein
MYVGPGGDLKYSLVQLLHVPTLEQRAAVAQAV